MSKKLMNHVREKKRGGKGNWLCAQNTAVKMTSVTPVAKKSYRLKINFFKVSVLC